MSRAIDGTKRKNRRVKLLKLAKGFKGDRKSNYKAAKDAVVKALDHSYVGRKLKKRDYRSLWIARINAAVRAEGMSYSRLMGALHKSGIEINRKVLADLAMNEPEAFKAIVQKAKNA